MTKKSVTLSILRGIRRNHFFAHLSRMIIFSFFFFHPSIAADANKSDRITGRNYPRHDLHVGKGMLNATYLPTRFISARGSRRRSPERSRSIIFAVRASFVTGFNPDFSNCAVSIIADDRRQRKSSFAPKEEGKIFTVDADLLSCKWMRADNRDTKVGDVLSLWNYYYADTLLLNVIAFQSIVLQLNLRLFQPLWNSVWNSVRYL